jgi:serine/threonine-protein kinase
LRSGGEPYQPREKIMPARPAPIIVFVLLCLGLAGTAAYYLPVLPERLATHFDAAGRANGWSDHAGFVESVSALVVIMAAIFLGGGLIGRIPDRLINLPNKGYWLAPERRDQALAFLRDWLRWFIVLTLAMLTLIIGMALRANLAAPPELSGYATWVIAAYVVLVLAMLLTVFRRFRAPAP